MQPARGRHRAATSSHPAMQPACQVSHMQGLQGESKRVVDNWLVFVCLFVEPGTSPGAFKWHFLVSHAWLTRAGRYSRRANPGDPHPLIADSDPPYLQYV